VSRRRWAGSSAIYATLAGAAFIAGPAIAQEIDIDPGNAIGQAIAAGTVLGFDGFAASGRFEVDDEADSRLRIVSLEFRHFFRSGERWQPYVKGGIGQVTVDQKVDLGVPIRGDSEFDVRGVVVGGGVRRVLGRGWFGEIGAAVDYSSVEQRLGYPDEATEAALGPLLDGVLFNWDAKALTTAGHLVAGWEHRPAGRAAVTIEGELVLLRTDPFDTDDPAQDVAVDATYERLATGVEVPLGRSAFGRPLRFDARIRRTFLDRQLADPLDTDNLDDVRVALIGLRPAGSRSRLPGLGLAVTYTTADSFDGWSVGVILAR
jgi:hypothetical protein